MREFLETGIVGKLPNKPNFYEINYNEAIELDDIKPYLKEIYERWDRLGLQVVLKEMCKRNAPMLLNSLLSI